MKFIKVLVVFLIINFGALAIGGWLMENGPQTDWYLNLNKAPWTPQGWVFGVAWTTIMLCFSIYMTFLYLNSNSNKILIWFLIQFVLNVSWNYIFFNKHLIGIGLITIVMLTIAIFYFLTVFWRQLRLKSLLLMPYFLWLCIATSLNLYIVVYN